MNTFGRNLRLTTFGESHGPAIGGIIDGFPPGIKIDFDEIKSLMSERSPGSSPLVSQRKEEDFPEFLSGINDDNITLGTPIGFIIRNQDSRSKDYTENFNKYRPNHADFTYDQKYGIRDPRGGGRASAREAANWVVAGAFALQLLKKWEIKIQAVLSGVGEISYRREFNEILSQDTSISDLIVPENIRNLMYQQILAAKNNGDSIGGTVTALISGLPAGLGSPVFDKLNSRLAQAMMSINAAKGFEYGAGFDYASKMGSHSVDIFSYDGEKIFTKSNYSGGIQGGISNGMNIYFNVAFKPTATIMKTLETVTNSGEADVISMKGRHDPCVAIRAIPIVKALTSLVIADELL